jgi:hypothetical protein
MSTLHEYDDLIIYCVGYLQKNEMGGASSTYGERRDAYRVLVGKPEGKRSLGRSRGRLEDNINMDLQKVGCEGMDWIELAQDRDRWRENAKAVMNRRGFIKCGEFHD